MAVSILSAQRSKDPNTQVGACIVNTENKIVGIGYNGFPKNCSDDALPWSRKSEDNSILNTKYPFVCHAEMNAIMNKNEANLNNCTMFVSLFPCNECAKLIIQSGIKKLVYLNDQVAFKKKIDFNQYKLNSSLMIDCSMLLLNQSRLPKSSFAWLELNSSTLFLGEIKSPSILKSYSTKANRSSNKFHIRIL